MKIAITGPHCCGKTTVIEKVKREVEQLVGDKICFHFFSGENAPVDYSSSRKLSENCHDELRLTYWMISQLIERECVVEGEENRIHVFDRCLFDQNVYTKVLLSEELGRQICDLVHNYDKVFPYDYVMILPMNMELLQKYGTKDKSEEYVRKIDELYKKLASELGIRAILLPQNQELQVKMIKEILLKKGGTCNESRYF